MNQPERQKRRFPRQGQSRADITSEIEHRRGDDINWNSSHNLKAAYDAGDDVTDISWDAYTKFSGDNLLYGGKLYKCLPDIMAEVVDMALELMNAPEDADGTVTTGGTESITLAVQAARNWARENRPVSGTPEIVVPINAHPAFNKAAELMDLKVVRVPTKNYRGDPQAMAKAITDNTIMIVGSAPAYPLGHVDPIESFADIARKHNLWLHVDACVGGFFLPFAVDLGYDVPAFDFKVPGVRSISADLHKYGYTARGASLCLLRDASLKRYHTFAFSSWPAGTYATPTFTGSRPAGAVVSAWTVLNYLGFDGYRERVAKILDAKEQMIAAVDSIQGLHLCGAPEAGIFGWRGDDDIDMHAVFDAMTERGWHTCVVMDPPGLQVLINQYAGEIVRPFAKDLAQVIDLVRTGRIEAEAQDRSYGT